jgi:hypothetical protein
MHVHEAVCTAEAIVTISFQQQQLQQTSGQMSGAAMWLLQCVRSLRPKDLRVGS